MRPRAPLDFKFVMKVTSADGVCVCVCMSMSVLFACLVSTRPEEGVGSLGAVVETIVSHHNRCWESNWGPREE